MSDGSYASRNAAAFALHNAIATGNVGGVEEILQRLNDQEKRVIVCGRNSNGKDALAVALDLPRPHMQALLQESMALQQAMTDALQRGDFEAALSSRLPIDPKSAIVQLLVAAGAEISTDSVIHETMHGGYSNRSELFQRATPSAINGINQEGWTALQLAVFHDKGYSTLDDLLQAGANPNMGGPAAPLPLVIALTKKRGLSVVDDLLSKGANPNGQDHRGQSALQLAMHPDVSYHTLESLLTKGADVNFQDSKGRTVLHRLLTMVDKDYSTCVDVFLEARRFDPNIRDGQGMIALHYHAKYGVFQEEEDDDNDPLLRLAARLPGQQAEHMRQLQARTRQSQREMQQQQRRHRQQSRKHRRQADKLMRRHKRQMRNLSRQTGQQFQRLGVVWGEDDEEDEDDEDSASEDDEANDRGDESIVSALIRAGSDIDSNDGRGRTPLFYAAEAGHFEILVALLQAGANPNTTGTHENSPINMAITNGHTGIVEALLQAGSTVRALEPGSHNSCLHLATRNRRETILGVLLHSGADPNAMNLQLVTPLRYAVEAGSLFSVEALIGAGANVNTRDNQGCTPLHYAALAGNIPIWDLLLQSGSDVHKQDKFGMTALMRAAHANLEMNSLFLFLGSDPTQVNLTM